MAVDSSNATLVERVRSFVNTYERHEDDDRLSSPAALVDYFDERQLLDAGAEGRPTASPADLELAHELRSALRDLLRHDRSPESEARNRLDRLSAELPLRVELRSDGQPYLVPAVSGIRHSLARVLAAVAALSPDDWARLKVCPAHDCEWVFYDSSRNRSRRWCSMEGCGNRSKVRAYRQRR